MIILKHLTVERFRLLREINLHFPQRGSILIQGPNEAGKSALLESIYFALYGTSLAANRNKRTLDDLILYGASQASVTLTLSIGATEMTINRMIERGQGQKVTLQVHKLGMPDEEPITGLATANERIIAELGRMDGETLRNSCFVEQKGLHLLENLPGSEREATVRKLLGLEKLLRLTGQFKLTPNDEHLLDEAREHFKLAEMQTRIPTLSAQLDQLEADLDAVTVCENLAEISQQEADIVEQQQILEQIAAKRADLKARQHRVQQLHKAANTLAEIIAAYETMAEARREIPELDLQIAELDRREHEELPALERRVSELVDLIRSFGTLERMSNDLLTSVNAIKELEHTVRQEQNLQRELDELTEQISSTYQQVDQVRQTFNELEERKRTGQPRLEDRLKRLRGLQGRLAALQQAEEEYMRRSEQQPQAEENAAQLEKVRRDVQAAEQQLAQAEVEAKQAQQRLEVTEKHWSQLNIGPILEEWQRLKGILQNQALFEQHKMVAHQNQERLTRAALDARSAANKALIFIICCGLIALLLLVAAGASAVASLPGVAVILAFFAVLAGGGTYYFYKKHHSMRSQEQVAHQQMQEALNQIGQLAAREGAMRKEDTQDSLGKIEREIRALGLSVPRSREDAQHLMQQIQPRSEDMPALQQKLTEERNAARSASDRVKTRTEILNNLRNEHTRLEEQRKKEHWDDLEGFLRSLRISLQDKQHDIATRAGQEGLPIPSVVATAGTVVTMPKSDLVEALTGAIKATEEEIASLDNELNSLSELAAQVKLHQDTLDLLLARKQTLTERMEPFGTQKPSQQLERARQQQQVLRTALQNLQDSLRQRVKPLGVSFGQAAISNAEAAARRQLDALHFTLGSRVELQSRRDNYANVLKERQELLADHYNQLAKFSSSLGSWIVPPNPFAEALATLRARCQQEISDAREETILQELEKLQMQEGASKAKIALCGQEISQAQERIAVMLVQHNRPPARTYTPADITAIWPLVGKHTPKDRSRLTEERAATERALQDLEKQELELSKTLQTGPKKLDLEQCRLRMEQQERSYETKKRGSALLQAVSERLQHKILPRTEYFMQQILPLLTSGRYHDVHLRTEKEEGTISGGPFQLQIWDTSAGEYVSMSALSGGAADQIALALRLAFAIATLPRELAAAPGFVFLDEPLSSFDRGRTQALVDVVTGESLSQHFEQVLLVSHSSAFDPAMFPYHIYMEGGSIIASNVPVVSNFQPLATGNDNGNGEHTSDDVNASVSATI
jgi:DNA repair exonuclease SbcCD ATPase subunit